ncbi:MAG: hypothetical protein ACXWL2_03220 [Candidatus Chromulinivorax sp.]
MNIKIFYVQIFIIVSSLNINSYVFADTQTIAIYQTQEKIDQEFPEHSTEKYIYAINTHAESTDQIENEENKVPKIINDTIHYNYFNNGLVRTVIISQIKKKQRIITTKTWTTANPSYLTWKNGALVIGAAAIGYMTYLGLQKWKSYQLEKEQELAAFKALPQWQTPETIEDLERDLQGISNFDEINFPLLYIYVNKLNPEQYSYFINRARAWYVNNPNQMAETNALLWQTTDLKDNIADITQPFYKNDPYFKDLKETPYLDTNNILFTAYHEAGHALMQGLTDEITIAKELNLIPQGMAGAQVSYSTSIPNFTKKLLSKDNKNNLLQILERRLLLFLAGGQGYQILIGERLPAHKFLDSAYTKSIGMGSMKDTYTGKDNAGNIQQTDMSQFADICEKYIRIKNNIPKSQPLDYEKDIMPVAIEMYEKGYDILDAHKDRLRALAQKAYKEKILYTDDIYTTIDIERAPYLHEFLIPKPILDLGKKATAFLQSVDDVNQKDYFITV